MLEYDPNKLYGFYRGMVLKHLSHGMCKIFIPGIYDNKLSAISEADKLPDAEPAPPLFGGCHNGNGMFSYPDISATVWVFFENQDVNYPVYFASTLGGEEALKQYDDVRNVAPNPSFIHKIHCRRLQDPDKFSYIKIWETGQIVLAAEDSATGDFAKIILNADGQATITSSKTITITSKNVDINGQTQMNLTSPSITNNAQVQQNIISPSINLDASQGLVTVKSYNGSHGSFNTF